MASRELLIDQAYWIRRDKRPIDYNDNDLFSPPKYCVDRMRMREGWGEEGLAQATLP